METKSNTGYFIICLIKLLKNFLVHRLVAKIFINNKENKPQVNHIKLNINDSNISSCALCKRKSTGGYIWSYTKL